MCCPGSGPGSKRERRLGEAHRQRGQNHLAPLGLHPGEQAGSHDVRVIQLLDVILMKRPAGTPRPCSASIHSALVRSRNSGASTASRSSRCAIRCAFVRNLGVQHDVGTPERHAERAPLPLIARRDRDVAVGSRERLTRRHVRISAARGRRIDPERHLLEGGNRGQLDRGLHLRALDLLPLARLFPRPEPGEHHLDEAERRLGCRCERRPRGRSPRVPAAPVTGREPGEHLAVVVRSSPWSATARASRTPRSSRRRGARSCWRDRRSRCPGGRPPRLASCRCTRRTS